MGSRDELRNATGATKLPALKLADGTVLTHSRAIFSWIDKQR
jgi:glutathione S-transferase